VPVSENFENQRIDSLTVQRCAFSIFFLFLFLGVLPIFLHMQRRLSPILSAKNPYFHERHVKIDARQAFDCIFLPKNYYSGCFPPRYIITQKSFSARVPRESTRYVALLRITLLFFPPPRFVSGKEALLHECLHDVRLVSKQVVETYIYIHTSWIHDVLFEHQFRDTRFEYRCFHDIRESPRMWKHRRTALICVENCFL